MTETPARKEKKSSIEDAEEIREIFGALNESIPKLISGLLGSVYSPEAASNIAAAIGVFYSKLIEQGIPQELALEMTRGYVGALDFQKMINMVGDESGRSKHKTIHISTNDEEDDDEEI